MSQAISHLHPPRSGARRRPVSPWLRPVAVIAVALIALTSSMTALDTALAPSLHSAPAHRNASVPWTLVKRHGPPPRVYMVPPSIPSNCSKAVSRQLMRFFSTVPNGSIIRFPAGACYGEDAGLRLKNRKNLIIDGNGSTFQALSRGTPNRSSWIIERGSNIALENMAVIGANASAGTGSSCYYHPLEWQHGFDFQGTQGGLLDNVKANDVYGDFVEAEPDNHLGVIKSPPARNILVENSHFDGSGRMGVGLTDVQGFTVQNTYVGNVCWDAVDVELDASAEYGRNIRIINNTFGPVRFSIFANAGAGSGSHVGNVTVTGNVQQEAPVTCAPTVDVEAPSGSYRSGYTFQNNSFLTYDDSFQIVRGNDVTVSNNRTVYSDRGCSSMVGVVLADSHQVAITGNAFTKAAAIDSVDSRSTAVSSSNNTL